MHGEGTDEPLVWYEGANKYFLHADNQGSITSTTDINGTTINISTYDAYGKRTASNDNYSSRFSYTGQAYLKEISLYYYKARIYNQNLGRFMQTDPIGYSDGMNWYNYTGGDPVNGSDPSGMLSFSNGNATCEYHHWVGKSINTGNIVWDNGPELLCIAQGLSTAELDSLTSFVGRFVGAGAIVAVTTLTPSRAGCADLSAKCQKERDALRLKTIAEYKRRGYVHVWRLYGGKAGLYGGASCDGGGSCWTNLNPVLASGGSSYRARQLFAVYPKWNSFEYLAEGWADPKSIVSSKPANAEGPYVGGGNETSILFPSRNIYGLSSSRVYWGN